MANSKKNYSTKQDNVPSSDALRRQLIEEFIAQNKEDQESFQEFEAVPYESSQIVRSTAGGKGKKSNK